MNGVFFDSNVLLYTLACDDPRQAIAADLLAAGGTLSVQILNEFANVAFRKLELPWTEVVEALASLRALCAPPLPLTVATHEAALALAQRHRFTFYDALIISPTLEAGCATLLTKDMKNGLVVETRLTLHNPFWHGG